MGGLALSLKICVLPDVTKQVWSNFRCMSTIARGRRSKEIGKDGDFSRDAVTRNNVDIYQTRPQKVAVHLHTCRQAFSVAGKSTIARAVRAPHRSSSPLERKWAAADWMSGNEEHGAIPHRVWGLPGVREPVGLRGSSANNAGGLAKGRQAEFAIVARAVS